MTARSLLFVPATSDRKIDKAFGGGAEVWLRMQTSFDLAQALKTASSIKVKPYAPKAA